jgi:Zn2+/Cd2+-exporting ATPase
MMPSRPWPALQDHPEALAAIACGVFLALGWGAWQHHWGGLGIALTALSYGVGGYDSARAGWQTLWEERELDVDLLMIVAALGAAGLGWWQRDYTLALDGAVLILIFATSGALESYAMNRTASSIESLMGLTPDRARRIDDTWVPVEQLALGDRLLVKPGELIPTDAKIVSGSSDVNQAAITGEALPVGKTVGDEVFGGTVNGHGVLTLEVDRPPASSLIQRIVTLVQQAQSENTPSQNFIESFERVYAKAIVVAGLCLGTVPALVGWWSWETTIYRALIFLVVASPCALMAAIMPGLLSAIATGARQGILFKRAATLETLGRVRAIALDKTGTLTTGKLQVTQIWYRQADGAIASCGATHPTPEALATCRAAIAVEQGSEHMVGQAIVQWFQSNKFQGEPLPTASAIVAQPGVGIQGVVAQGQVQVGKLTPPHQPWPEVESARGGQTLAWIVIDGEIRGAIALQDQVRPEAAAAVKKLQQLGLHLVMLTGDNRASGAKVAAQLGIDEFYTDLLPEGKIAQLQQLAQRYTTVAMVGDGINDAPALAAAAVGVAMGQGGSDVTLETADVVLMTDDLTKLATAVTLGQRSLGVIKQNISLALGVIAVLLVGNFLGSVNLPLGVLGHEGSTVLITLSGLRLLKK